MVVAALVLAGVLVFVLVGVVFAIKLSMLREDSRRDVRLLREGVRVAAVVEQVDGGGDWEVVTVRYTADDGVERRARKNWRVIQVPVPAVGGTVFVLHAPGDPEDMELEVNARHASRF